MQEILLKTRHFGRGLSKSLKKVNLIFSFESNPIDDIINYSIFICPFESGKCEKKGKNLQKCEYFENEKSFLGEIKSIFKFLKGHCLVKKYKTASRSFK